MTGPASQDPSAAPAPSASRAPGADRGDTVGGPHPEGARGTLARLAAALRALDPSCGPVRLVGVDGHAGSGKSTFAGRLARALGDAPVLRLDDLASHRAPFAWTDRLTTRVLAPLRRGEPGRYAVYDWQERRFGPLRELPPAPVVLVEGVGAGRRALRPDLACLLWMDLPYAEAWRRGRLRDGPGLRAFWDDWTKAERDHFAHDPSQPHIHARVRQDDGGYLLLRGPADAPDPLAGALTRPPRGDTP